MNLPLTQDLLDRITAVVAASGDAELVAQYQNQVEAIGIDDPLDNAFRAAAASYERDGEVEIDDDALISRGCEDGAYVQMWRWVAGSELTAEEQKTYEYGEHYAEATFTTTTTS